jgi:hypothetical protein
MKNKIKQLFAVGFITYILIEIVCFIFIKTGYINANRPHFFREARDTMVFPYTYADINKNWGVWHYNYPVKAPYGWPHSCLTIACNPNSVGARDIERKPLSADSNRCIVLGDSFMEGFGIPDQYRVSNMLETSTGHEFLNFACSDMGSTQEYLVYKHLASRYDHNTILWGILPLNDLLNDNVEFDSSQSPLRYKPYWKGNYPDMELFYYTDSLQHSQFSYEAFKQYQSSFKYKVRHVLENTTCWFNILYFFIKKKGAADVINRATKSNMPYSGYYDFSERDLDRLKQSLLAVRRLGPDKKMIVFTIPVATDYQRYQKKPETPPLVQQLQSFCDSNGITFTDLLTTATATDLQQNKKQFFDCDSHWNEFGNQWAMKKLLPYFRESAVIRD